MNNFLLLDRFEFFMKMWLFPACILRKGVEDLENLQVEDQVWLERLVCEYHTWKEYIIACGRNDHRHHDVEFPNFGTTDNKPMCRSHLVYARNYVLRNYNRFVNVDVDVRQEFPVLFEARAGDKPESFSRDAYALGLSFDQLRAY